MKSIYFNQAPTMNGKLTMRYTDITVENFKPKIMKSLAEKQMATRCEDTDSMDNPIDYDNRPVSWDCHLCNWQYLTGDNTPHTHFDD